MPKRDDTFLLYYLEDFTEFEQNNCPTLFCLSPSTVEIILSALRFCVWPTRWRLNRDDNARRIEESSWPDARQWGELAIQEVTYNMACDIENGFTTLGDAIIAASPNAGLEKMAEAITKLANKPCCGDTVNLTVNGGVVTSWTDGEGVNQPIYGSEPPVTWGEGEFPPEFDSEADYKLNKCQVANGVFDGWLVALRNFSLFTVFNATALATLIGLAIPGIIAFPPAAIAVMVGALIALGVNIVVLGQVADELEANREQIVCDLYTSDTVETMTALLGDALDAIIATLSVSSGVGLLVKQVALLLVNGDTLNQLMKGIGPYAYPDADCSNCGPCQTFIPGHMVGPYPGTEIVTEDENSFSAKAIGSYNDRTRYDIGVFVNANEDESYCGDARTLVSLNINPFPTSGAGSYASLTLYGDGYTVLYTSTNPAVYPSLPMENVRVVYVTSASDSVVEAEFE